MATNLALDDKLLLEAQRLGGRKTKKDTVNEALLEYVQRRKQKRVVGYFGRVDYQAGYDYKAERKRR